MNFIICFDQDLKDKLINQGYLLLSQNDDMYIFENNNMLNFDFNSVDKKKYLFTNKLFL
jgi:hypothetical protein